MYIHYFSCESSGQNNFAVFIRVLSKELMGKEFIKTVIFVIFLQ